MDQFASAGAVAAVRVALADSPTAGGAKGDQALALRQSDPLPPVPMRIAAVAAIFASVAVRLRRDEKRVRADE